MQSALVANIHQHPKPHVLALSVHKHKPLSCSRHN